MNKHMDYSKLYYDFDMKNLIETILIGSMFVVAILHLVRLNHFLPNSYLGEYHVIAQRILDQNSQELQIENSHSDVIYSNKLEDDDEYISLVEYSTLDSVFAFFDFMI